METRIPTIMQLDEEAVNLFQGFSLAGAKPDEVPKLIRSALKSKLARVIDVFRQLDDDGSGTIDGPEFEKGLKEMGLDAPMEALGAIWASFDAGGSGLISYGEMDKAIVRSVRTHPKLPPLPLKAKNPVALRRGEVSKKNASLMQHLDLANAAPEELPALIRSAMQERLLRVIDVFRQLDDDGSGMIDGREFAKGLEEMGLRAPPEAVGAIFASFDPDGDELLEYDEMHELLARSFEQSPELPPLELSAKNPIALRKAPLSKKDSNLLQGAVDLENAAAEELPKLIREALNAKLTRVIDLFRQLDDDLSGAIDGSEFAKGLREMGLNAPKETVGAIFASFDEDGGAFIEYDELHELIMRSAQTHPDLPPLPLDAKNPISLRRKKINKQDANLLQSLDIDEAHLDRLPGQLKEALGRESVRVLDLFRQFDDDASGSISRAEFSKAMGELGLKVGPLGIRSAAERTKAVVADLFKMFNVDGGKSIEYIELEKVLRSATSFISEEQADELDDREDARLRPMTSHDNPSTKAAELVEPPRTADGKLGGVASRFPGGLQWDPPKPPAEPIYVPNYIEPLRFTTVRMGAHSALLFLHESAKGNLRGSEKLAVVMHALPLKRKPGGNKDASVAGRTLAASVSSLPLHRLLADEGWSILYVEPHSLGAPARAATDEADRKLRAAMAFVTSHRDLRYCKIGLLCQGPAASAALCAMAAEPHLFEYRVRALSACQPAPVAALSAVGRRGGGASLKARAQSVRVPTFITYAGESPLNRDVATGVYGALVAVGTPTVALGVPADGNTLFGRAQRFDGARFLGEDEGAWYMLRDFLEAHIRTPHRAMRPAPPPEAEVAAEGA